MSNETLTGEEPRGWFGSLGSYNAGKLVGEWVTIPDDEDELREVIATIVKRGEGDEWFMADSENLPGFFGEYPDLATLVEYVEELEAAGLDGIPASVFRAVSDDKGQTANRDRIHCYGEGRDDSDIAVAFVEGIGSLREAVGEDALERYFDWEAFGRDLRLDGFQIIEGMVAKVE